jgi:hypothetical protein
MTAIRESVYRTVARTGCAVAFSAVLAVGLGAPSARAQTSHDHDRTTTAGEYLVRSASFNGYSDGFDQGARDLKIGPDFKPQFDESFLRAETGYTRDMGPFADYQSAFRQAYSRGYDDAHYSRDRNPAMNLPPAPPEPLYLAAQSGPRTEVPGGRSLGVASAKGYDAGYMQGAEDRRSGASYGYREETIYRAATDGYHPDLGDETRYQVVFRQIYARGYSDGFNGRARYTDTAILAEADHPDQTLPSESRSDVLGIAIASGYHEGFEQGTLDRKAHRSFGYRDYETYRQATTGHDSGRNLEPDYKTTFRQGYAGGYKAGYYGRTRNQIYEDRYDQHSGYRPGADDRGAHGDSREHGTVHSSTTIRQAADGGYRAGHERGQHDRQIGMQKPNPQGHGAYQFALDGWEPSFGDRSTYQQEFRTSFLRGYDDGFQGRGATSVPRPR